LADVESMIDARMPKHTQNTYYKHMESTYCC